MSAAAARSNGANAKLRRDHAMVRLYRVMMLAVDGVPPYANLGIPSAALREGCGTPFTTSEVTDELSAASHGSARA
ncbi:hypothetical protein OIE50_24025 [Streptomyces canus]|uniref:hypothetical protein n=1 Tax=Streptomyces canus TaxID=58343 RepID=UPI00324D4101